MMSKNYLVLIIQARMNSTRFPNKVISDLSGSPLIERILQRVKKVKKIGKIIIATTKRREDDILVKIAKSNKVEVFRGSENRINDIINGNYDPSNQIKNCVNKYFFNHPNNSGFNLIKDTIKKTLIR